MRLRGSRRDPPAPRQALEEAIPAQPGASLGRLNPGALAPPATPPPAPLPPPPRRREPAGCTVVEGSGRRTLTEARHRGGIGVPGIPENHANPGSGAVAASAE